MAEGSAYHTQYLNHFPKRFLNYIVLLSFYIVNILKSNFHFLKMQKSNPFYYFGFFCEKPHNILFALL